MENFNWIFNSRKMSLAKISCWGEILIFLKFKSLQDYLEFVDWILFLIYSFQLKNIKVNLK